MTARLVEPVEVVETFQRRVVHSDLSERDLQSVVGKRVSVGKDREGVCCTMHHIDVPIYMTAVHPYFEKFPPPDSL